MENKIKEIMKSSYIRLLKLPSLSGGFYFAVTTDKRWKAEAEPIGTDGYAILGRAYEEERTIYRSNHDDGSICYIIYKN